MMSFAVAAALPLAAAAHDETKPAAQAPPMPQPGPEHAMLAKDVGVWDATVEMWMAPGQPPSVSKGTETNTLLGGFWLLTDFKSDFLGQPFQGHGVTGYDPARKKFVGTWMDSMSPGIYLAESTYDADKKMLTAFMDGPGPDGKPSRMKETTEWKDADTRVFTMYPEGSEQPTMRITYKRKK